MFRVRVADFFDFGNASQSSRAFLRTNQRPSLLNCLCGRLRALRGCRGFAAAGDGCRRSSRKRKGFSHVHEDGDHVVHDLEQFDEEVLQELHEERSRVVSRKEGMLFLVLPVAVGVMPSELGVELVGDLGVVGEHPAAHDGFFELHREASALLRHGQPSLIVEDQAQGGIEEAVDLPIGAGETVLAVLDEMAGAALLDHDGQSGSCRLQGNVSESFHARWEEEDVAGGVGGAEFVAAHPSGVHGVGKGLHGIFAGSGADDQSLERDVLGGQPSHHLLVNVRSLFGHQPSHPADDDVVIVESELLTELPRPVHGREFGKVDASAPNAQVGHAVHLGRLAQLAVDVRGGDVQRLQEVVLVAEEGGEDELEPPEARVVVHVLRDVAVVGSHERDLHVAGVLDHVEAGAVGRRDVNEGRLEVHDLLLGRPAQREAQAVTVVWVVRIMQERDRNAVLEEDDGPVRVLWDQMGVLGVAAVGADDANMVTGRQDLLLDLPNGQRHSVDNIVACCVNQDSMLMRRHDDCCLLCVFVVFGGLFFV
mmetsp:Transcript_4913/g.14237  ORF Transcript_4913/g.14237 Transcript_4913/m.14237 type:complete len:536 (-) Transcript_4913:425-2032(-)